MNEMKKPAEPSKKAGVIVFLVLVALVAGCFKFACNDTEPKYTKEQKDSVFGAENKGMAYIMSQDFLKRSLKSPATAEFPNSLDKVVYNGDSVFTINSYVDSQNSFGAMLRTNYYAKVKYTGNDNWSLIDIKLIEQ